MFKLVKILNSPTTVPETVRRKTAENGYYKRGTLLKMSADGVVKSIVVGEMPTHVCCEDLETGKSDSVRCYAISESMIFSAPALCGMEEVTNGVKVCLETDDDGIITYVTPFEDSGYVTIHDTCGAADTGDTVLIRFIN